MNFQSCFKELGAIELPAFSGIRIMMMPVILGDASSVPDFLSSYQKTLGKLFDMGGHAGEVGYLTIDEKVVPAGKTHRRAGAHVDGIYRRHPGAWAGGWGSAGVGMLTVSSVAGCRAWQQRFDGWPGDEGQCGHLMPQADKECERVFDANTVFWVDGLCVHESMPMERDTPRQFVRLSLPSAAPWFEGYTVNPLGILPTGPILARREFMDEE